MTVGPEDTAAHLRRRSEQERRLGFERALRLRERLPEARALLREQHGARRVWLFGSVQSGTATAASDVDLGVEGMPAERYFSALAELMTLFGTAVDLVRVEEACAPRC